MNILKQPGDDDERYECKIYLLLGYVMDEVMNVDRHKDPLKYMEHLDNVSEFRLPTLLNLLKNNYSSKCLVAKAIFDCPDEKAPDKSDPSIFEVIERCSLEDSRQNSIGGRLDDDIESVISDTSTITCMPVYNNYLRLIGSSTTTLVGEKKELPK